MDLEMTGLDHTRDVIVEIATIVTDDGTRVARNVSLETLSRGPTKSAQCFSSPLDPRTRPFQFPSGHDIENTIDSMRIQIGPTIELPRVAGIGRETQPTGDPPALTGVRYFVECPRQFNKSGGRLDAVQTVERFRLDPTAPLGQCRDRREFAVARRMHDL